jgi:ubiquinone/menaquinone biosynthesis C-methylase UbiE
MENDDQRKIFLANEGDAWFKRNKEIGLNEPDHIDECIINQLSECNSVLEIGCADGRRLSRLRQKFGPNIELAGIDPSEAAITFGKASFPSLDLRIGTADSLPADKKYDTVILGFCLYLCDRELLSKIVSEVDRVLNDQGSIVIVDFDPPHPRRRKYRHHEGVWSFKMDYSKMFTALPHFVLSYKKSMSHLDSNWSSTEGERIAVWMLRKNIAGGYSEESDF